MNSLLRQMLNMSFMAQDSGVLEIYFGQIYKKNLRYSAELELKNVNPVKIFFRIVTFQMYNE